MSGSKGGVAAGSAGNLQLRRNLERWRCLFRLAFNIAHGLAQHLIAAGGLSIAVRPQQLSEMAYDVSRSGAPPSPLRGRKFWVQSFGRSARFSGSVLIPCS